GAAAGADRQLRAAPAPTGDGAASPRAFADTLPVELSLCRRYIARCAGAALDHDRVLRFLHASPRTLPGTRSVAGDDRAGVSVAAGAARRAVRRRHVRRRFAANGGRARDVPAAAGDAPAGVGHGEDL